MIIDQLPLLLGDGLLTDEFPIERGTTTYKATLSQILSSVFAAIEPNFAGAYDSTATYAVGDYVVYEHTLYVCNTAIPTAEQWTAAHWTQVDIGTVLQSKQNKITASGILKGNGSGGVSAAVAGTDYLTPATNYSPWKAISANYSIEASDAGKTIRRSLTNSALTITMSAAVGNALPDGAEIGFLVATIGISANETILDFSATSGCKGVVGGSARDFTKFKIVNGYDMVVVKKIWGSSGGTWLVQGNVEVVT